MSAAQPAVSVIIVLYNSADTIGRCLAALDAQTYRDFELILVDNDSPQREIDSIDVPPYARVIRAGANLGFAAGNNRAAETRLPILTGWRNWSPRRSGMPPPRPVRCN
jgi:GT2 family glycosyltransferase